MAKGAAPPGVPADRRQFLALAARAMRQVLVDYARKHQARKRGNGEHRVTLAEGMLRAGGSEIDALALHDALEHLTELDARMAQVVELRFFGGLGAGWSAGSSLVLREVRNEAPTTTEMKCRGMPASRPRFSGCWR